MYRLHQSGHKLLMMALGFIAFPLQALVVTEDEQTSLRLTIYNQDFAVIQDHRQLPQLDAHQQVHVEQMSAQMLPETLRIQHAGKILEQGFSESKLNYLALLRAYIGQPLQIARLNPSNGQETLSPIELLSIESSHALIRRNARIESIPLNSSEWRFIFPAELPSQLQGKQGIHFVSAGTDQQTTAQLSYLSNGLGWSMDYVLTLDAQGDTVDIEGLASVYNNSGGDFNDAELRLMAGEVNAPDNRQPMMMHAMAMSDSVGSSPERGTEAVQDFYLYSLPNPVSFQHNESKQLPLINLRDIPAKLSYHYEFPVWPALDNQHHQAQADVRLHFDVPTLAEQASPLPAGQVRVFRPDRQQDMQFIGASNLSNLGAGETAELALGRAFDVNIKRRQILFSDGFDSVTIQQEVMITNSGREGRVVDVGADFQQEWTLKDSTHPMEASGAAGLTAQMHIAAGGSETLRFTVELKKRIHR